MCVRRVCKGTGYTYLQQLNVVLVAGCQFGVSGRRLITYLMCLKPAEIRRAVRKVS